VNGEAKVTMNRRDALLALLSGGAALGAVTSALRRGAPAPGAVGASAGHPRLLPLRADVGSLSEREKGLLWQLAVATGALWSMSELSETELRGFLDLKTQSPPSYLTEYRNALDIFAAACRDHAPPEAVEAILRRAPGQRAVEHARQFVIAEFIALHLASGGFHQFGLTRFRAFIGDGYRVSPIQPGTRR
jgi:hypothetical protein